MKMASKEFHLSPKKSSTNSLRDAKPSVGATTDRRRPTIEAIEGDRIRLLVTNKLPNTPACTGTASCLPSGMDGVGGLVTADIRQARPMPMSSRCASTATHMYHRTR